MVSLGSGLSLSSSACTKVAASWPLAMNHWLRMLYGSPSIFRAKFISALADEMLYVTKVYLVRVAAWARSDSGRLSSTKTFMSDPYRGVPTASIGMRDHFLALD